MLDKLHAALWAAHGVAQAYAQEQAQQGQHRVCPALLVHERSFRRADQPGGNLPPVISLKLSAIEPVM